MASGAGQATYIGLFLSAHESPSSLSSSCSHRLLPFHSRLLTTYFHIVVTPAADWPPGFWVPSACLRCTIYNI